jgi:hypothetical protein
MEEIENFSKLTLDDDLPSGSVFVVGHGQVGSRVREVVIPRDETSYEKVCLQRWPNSVEEKRLLDKRFNILHTWQRFYEVMEDKMQRFAKKLVYEQRRTFGAKSQLPSTSSKRQKSDKDRVHLPAQYSIMSVAANAEFAAVLVRSGEGEKKSPGGRLWTVSTSNFPESNWRRSDVKVSDFQVGYILGDVLYIVSGTFLYIYKLPRAEHVYRLDVWETHKVMIAQNTNVIRASSHLVALVTRSRGFIVWRIVNRTLQLLHYQNTNTVAECNYQYTTASIFMDTVVFGRTDGYVETWKVSQRPDGQFFLEHLADVDWFTPVHSTVTGKLIEPKRGKPIYCIELSGPKLAVSTETDLVMVNEDFAADNRTLCKLTDIATPASITLFGDMIALMTRDGGFQVAEFASGRTYCNTVASIEDAPEDCVVGQQWTFIAGDFAAGLWPNGNINALNQNRSAKEI